MREFDELKTRAMPYEQYFGEMDLTEEEKEKRIKLAQDLEEAMLFFFALLATMTANAYANIQFAIDSLVARYAACLGQYMDLDEYISGRIMQFATETLETTQSHADDGWYTSNDRAMLVAENESNTSWNYDEYRTAVKSGKTKKKWIAMQDKRVRHTHRQLSGKTIPIESIFLVGNSEMYFPKDETFSPETCETANCRCSIKYF